MKPLFEIPELLTLSGDPFSFGSELLEPGNGCQTGCDDGCNSGCDMGSGKGSKPTEPEV
jgi:hypothetical protein